MATRKEKKRKPTGSRRAAATATKGKLSRKRPVTDLQIRQARSLNDRIQEQVTSRTIEKFAPKTREEAENLAPGRSPGLQDFKAGGGLTFAQNPATAPEPKMPEGDGNSFNQLYRLLRNKMGVDFAPYRRAAFQRRVKRRMTLHQLARLEDYVQFIQRHPEEVRALFEDLLIPVTGFFRDPEVFAELKRSVFAKLIAERKDGEEPIRIWVPGCASGEEVYSLAINLFEALTEGGAHLPVQIFATDLSEEAINKAHVGIYPADIRADVSAARRRRFFTRVGGGFQINRALRDACIFATHDLTRDPPFSRLDLISCRNLLIYLDPPLQKRVLQSFAYSLKPGGYLVLGPAESATAAVGYFSLLDRKHALYTRKTSALRARIELRPTPGPRGQPEIKPVTREKDPLRARDGTTGLQAEINRAVVAKYDPACVLVNEDLRILQFIGKIGRFLKHGTGDTSLDLLKLARNGLRLELRSAMREARSSTVPVLLEGVPFQSSGAEARTDIEVRPLQLRNGERFYLVFFEERLPERKRSAGRTAGKPGREAEDQTVLRLRSELIATIEYLKSSLRELEVANEELQSANEEILSSNEELQSANEELETAKEELTTVNEELSTQNAQLSQLSDDLRNLLTSVNIPIVMVDNQVRIRRFTSQSEKLLNLIPADVGRPISDIKPNLDLPDLKAMVAETIETKMVKEAHVRDPEGKSYSLCVRPFRTVENKIGGAVITIRCQTPFG